MRLLTPREAAALVVARLPHDCVSAFEGLWPPPESESSTD